MRTLKEKIAVSGQPSSPELITDLKTQEQIGSTWEFLTDSANVKVILYSVFTDDDGTETEGEIKEITLTAGTLVLYNLPFKVSHVRCKFDDTGSAMSGTLRVKASTYK